MSKPFPVLLLLPLATILISGMVFAADQADTNFDQLHNGNEAFNNGEYEVAINIYTKLLTEYGKTDSLYFNLANSYAQLDKPGMAILFYNKGLLLSPHNPDIIGNLSTVRKSIGIEPVIQTPIMRLVQYFSPNQWWLQALIFFLLFSLNLNISRLFPFLKKPLFIIQPILFSLILSTIVGAIYRTNYMKDAVVTLGEKKLLISPYKNGPVLTNIPEGTEVWVDDAYQDYIYVHLENDIAGWIEKEAIMKIRP